MTQYIYSWKNNSKRASLWGRRCKLLHRDTMGNCLIKFENGQRECVKINSLRKEKVNTLPKLNKYQRRIALYRKAFIASDRENCELRKALATIIKMSQDMPKNKKIVAVAERALDLDSMVEFNIKEKIILNRMENSK